MRRALIWVGAVVAVVVGTGALLLLATSGAASFRTEGARLFVSGQLTLMSTERIDTLTEENPELRIVVLEEIAAQSDPTALIQKGGLIRSLGLGTEIAPGVTISGPAVYLFLGGVTRTLGEGSAIAVSDWQTTVGPASALAEDHPAHAERRGYVAAMLGGPAFYDFMLGAAPVGDARVLTPEELATFGIVAAP